MICRHLKVCILLAFAAVLCGGRVFGDTRFWCPECKENIECERWGRHVYDKHKGDMGIRPSVQCPYCPRFIIQSVSEWQRHRNQRHFAQDVSCPCHFVCRLCGEDVAQKEWFMHLWFIHLYTKNFVSSLRGFYHAFIIKGGSFPCKECKCEVPRALCMEHLREKHSSVLEPIHFCGICEEEVDSTKWNEHMKKHFKSNEWCFDCPKCGEKSVCCGKHVAEKHASECLYCSATVKDEGDRKKHMEEKHKVLCPVCKKQIVEIAPEAHGVREHNEAFCPVESCKEQCFHGTVLRHLYQKHGDCWRECKLCKIPVALKDLASHCDDSSHNSNGYYCKLCNDYYLGQTYASHVPEYHHEKIGWWCVLCKAIVPWTWELAHVSHKNHMTRVHSGVYVECKYCRRLIPLCLYVMHVKKQHPYLCGRCEVAFKTDLLLLKHNDSGHGKHVCTYCKYKAFNSKFLLWKHYKNEHAAAEFCDVCEIGFKEKSKAFKHALIRHKDVVYACEDCQGIFPKEDEEKHKKLHRLDCPLCDFFIDPIKQGSAFLLEHMRGKHHCPPSCGFDKNLEFKHVLSCDNYVGAWRCPVCGEKCRGEDIAIHNTTVHRCSEKCHIDTECKSSLKWIHDESCKYQDDPNLASFLCPICRVEDGNVWHMKNMHGCSPECGLRGYKFAHAEDCRYFDLSYPCPLCFKSECTEEHMYKEHGCLSDACLMWHYMRKAVWRHASECRNYDAEKEKTLNKKLGDDFEANYEEYENVEYEDGEYEEREYE